MKALTIVNGDGSTSQYVRFSQRLPLFLEAFPASDGWRVERTSHHAAENAPSLVRLWEKAVEAGMKPMEIGLPALPGGTVFVAKLLDCNGNVVASGSALFNVRDPGQTIDLEREHEAGETAAFQRLIAALGMGGDVLDSDEAKTIGLGNGQLVTGGPVGLRSVPASARTTATAQQITAEAVPCEEHHRREPAASSSADEVAKVEAVEVDEAVGDTTPAPITVTAEACVPTTVVERPATTAKVTKPAMGLVLKALQRSIDQLSKKHGRETVQVDTLEDAEAVLAELGALKKGA